MDSTIGLQKNVPGAEGGIFFASALSGMPHVVLLVLLFLQGLPAQAMESQTSMSEEVVALHRAIFERPPDQVFVDTTLARDLGLRYLYGRGVDRDVVQGCALLHEAYAMALAPTHDQIGIDVAQGLIDQHCRNLGADQAAEMAYVNACGFIGLQRQVLPLQPGTWVEFSRRGIVIERPTGRAENWFAGDPTCARHVKLLRSVLAPGAEAQAASYMIEMLSWQGARYKGVLRRELEWRLFKIGSTRLEVFAQDVVFSEPGSLWPPPPLPDGFRDGASLRRTQDGAIHWTFAGGSSGGVIRQ